MVYQITSRDPVKQKPNSKPIVFQKISYTVQNWEIINNFIVKFK